MKRQTNNQITTAMIDAVRTGTNWVSANTSVQMGAVISKGSEPYARNREVRVNGMLVATMGKRMFLRVPVNDVLVIDRLNALLHEFFGDGFKIGRTPKHKELFVTHPKPNSLTGKIGPGTTFLFTNEWWEVTGESNLDCTVLASRYD